VAWRRVSLCAVSSSNVAGAVCVSELELFAADEEAMLALGARIAEVTGGVGVIWETSNLGVMGSMKAANLRSIPSISITLLQSGQERLSQTLRRLHIP